MYGCVRLFACLASSPGPLLSLHFPPWSLCSCMQRTSASQGKRQYNQHNYIHPGHLFSAKKTAMGGIQSVLYPPLYQLLNRLDSQTTPLWHRKTLQNPNACASNQENNAGLDWKLYKCIHGMYTKHQYCVSLC